MRFASLPLPFLIPLLPLLDLVNAQDQNSTSTYVQECVSALQSAGFTALAGVISTVNATQQGQTLFSQLSSGNNYTLFAPDNNAIQSVPPSVSRNSSLLAEYISYHFVSGDFKNESSGGGAGGGGSSASASASASSASVSRSSSRRIPSSTFSSSSLSESSSSASTSSESGSTGSTLTVTSTATSTGVVSLFERIGRRWNSPNSSSTPQPYSGVWPNVTIGRTLLNSSDFVTLPGNKSQVLVWTRTRKNGNIMILNQGRDVTISRGTTWRNLFINGINGVLTPPQKLSNALVAVNASALKTLLSSVQIPGSNGTNVTALAYLQNARGVTVFAPNNAAFSQRGIGRSNWNSPINRTAQVGVLENHYLNGTVLYSTLIAPNSNVTTAGGEPLQFRQNKTGLFVFVRGTSARIVRPDVLLDNGVAHIIDRVLFVEAVNPSAASQAYESATASAAAAAGSTETGPVGIIGGGSGPTVTQTISSFSPSSTSTSSSSSELPSSSSSSFLPSSTSSSSSSSFVSSSSSSPSTTETSTITTEASTTAQGTVTVTGTST